MILISASIIFLISRESFGGLSLSNYTVQRIFKSKNLHITALNESISEGDLQVKQIDAKNFEFSFTPKVTKTGTLPSIGIATAYMSYHIKYNDQLLYSYGESNIPIVKSRATDFNTVKIPAKYIGKKIIVSFKFNVSKLNVTPAKVYVGEKKEIVKQIFKQEFPEIVFSLFMFVVGSTMLILGLMSTLFKLYSNSYISGGIFTILLSFYVFIKTETVYLFIKNPIVVYFLIFNCTSGFSASLAYLLNQHVKGRRKPIGKMLLVIIVLNITVQTLLTITGISEYIYFREFNFLVILTVSAIMFYILLINRDSNYPLKNESKSNKILISATIIMLIGLIIASIMYNVDVTSNFIMPVYFTLTLFVMIQFFVYLETYAKDYKKAQRLNHFKTVALYDNLTKVGSRFAFDSDMALFKENIYQYHSISLIMIDINNLKKINDNLGHDSGDKALADMGRVISCLESSFSNVTLKAYRLSGDEFIIVMFNTDIVEHEQLEKSLLNCYQAYLSSHKDSLLSFSHGAVYSEIDHDFNFENFVKNADQKMYQNKIILKANDINQLQFIKRQEKQNEQIY